MTGWNYVAGSYVRHFFDLRRVSLCGKWMCHADVRGQKVLDDDVLNCTLCRVRLGKNKELFVDDDDAEEVQTSLEVPDGPNDLEPSRQVYVEGWMCELLRR